LRLLEPANMEVAGVRDDSMLLSYLLNPIYANHTLGEVATRVFRCRSRRHHWPARRRSPP
jgi:DNA polymerase I-like protein with 3'-5' exonuclease and polymerase domains